MIVDIIIIIILALSIFIGYKRGLIEIGIKLCAVVIALVLTLGLYRPISDIIINNTNLDETIEQAIIDKSQQVIGTNEEANLLQEGINYQLDVVPNIARELALNIVRTIVMLILYIITKIALGFVTALANIVAKLPILNQFNELGGIIFGAIRGIVIVYVSLLIISFIGQVNPSNKIQLEVDKSLIGKQMYKYNVIQLLVK